jgi:TolB-like protein/cytochrome c-type biogenesis protein CcmH/NrfG
VEAASVEKMAFPLPDRPSIVVLPFKNMTGDPDQEYFSDGFTKAIITRLLKIPDVFVISGPSSRLYKGKKVKVHQVAEDLGVRYVLEGSVQKAGDRIRVTALLIDAITGEHRWAELYDRELKDIFAVQDEVIRKVVTELAVQMTQGEWARSMMHSSYNYEAVDYYLRADKELTKFEKEANILGRELLMKALELDPNYARAIAYLGWTNLYEVMNGWTKNPAESLQKAEELAKRAVFINENDYLGHALLSRIYTLKRQYELAIAAGKRSVEVEPNNSNAMVILGHTMMFAGKPAEALALSRKAMRLSPYPPSYFHHLAGAGNYFTGQYEAAINQYQKYLQRQQQGGLARFSRQSLIASYMELGREEEARVEVDKFLKQDPKICIEGLIKQTKRLPFKKYAFLDRQIELLRKAGLPQTPPLPLPDKPSIAVLPFVNMSGDPEQEYLSDGITEQIITGLSKVPKLFVIARTSSFKYKGKEIDVRKVGREVGVRYVLEGSVQKSENRLRITAQLIDAIEGHHLWSESYDRELKDIFALQDDITMKIITALEVKLTEGEKARLASKGTENLQAYLKYLQASGPFYTFTKEGNAQARRLLEEAIALDPEFPAAYLLLGNTQFMDVPFGASKNPRESIKRAFESINKAIALDEDFAGAHAVLGGMYILKERNYDKAIAECERALDLAPNLDVANIWMGIVLTWAGRHEEAVQYAEQALRLNPMPEPWSFRALGSAYFWVGRYEEAIAAYKKALQRAPDDILTHLYLTAAYSRAGRLEEARAEAEEVLRINPKFCVSRRPGVFKNPADDELIKNARRKAGLPDCPPRRGSK